MPQFYATGYVSAIVEAQIEAESQEAANERMADLMTHLPGRVVDDQLDLTWCAFDDEDDQIQPETVEDFRISSHLP